jgi:general secretion pathway protein G
MYRKSPSKPRRDRAGFTLIELLLVLVILVVLGAMAVQFFGGTRDKALKDAARAQISEFSGGVDRYEFDVRKYPTKLEKLLEKPSDKSAEERWTGPYIKATNLPDDPWDNAFRIAVPGKKNPNSYDIWSLGPDEQDGTEDDIGNW